MVINVWITTIIQFHTLYLNDYVASYDCENPNLPQENGFYIIPNTKAPTIIEDRPLLTIPPGFSIRKSSFPNAGLGVFAETWIPRGTRIGPYDGLMYSMRCETCKNSYTWAVHYDDIKSIKHYVNAGPKEYSSWLRYVNCANTVDQENVYYYQYNYEVYHVTYECIKPGTEISVWYGVKYGRLLGFNRTSEDYMRRFNESERRSIIKSSYSYGPTDKIFSHCYRFVNQSPGTVRHQTKLCRHWKAYIICRYFLCDMNPCTGDRDCENCRGYCFHVGHYYKPNQEFIGGDHVNKCRCNHDGNLTYEFMQSTFIDMCIYS